MRGFIQHNPVHRVVLKPAERGRTLSAAQPSAAVAAPAGSGSTAPAVPDGMVYADFDPLLLQQKQDKPMLEFTSFDAALDEFYSKARASIGTNSMRCQSLHNLRQSNDGLQYGWNLRCIRATLSKDKGA